MKRTHAARCLGRKRSRKASQVPPLVSSYPWQGRTHERILALMQAWVNTPPRLGDGASAVTAAGGVQVR